MALMHRACEATKGKGKSYKLADGKGLYLESFSTNLSYKRQFEAYLIAVKLYGLRHG